MDIKIVFKPTFTVLGIEGQGKVQDASRWIKPLWEAAVTRIDEIERFITGNGWGLMSAVDEPFGPWKDGGKYLAGWEVRRDTEAPVGWTIWKVPESTYAVVPCTMKSYGEVWKYFHETFLPDSGYERSGSSHEFYPPEFRDIDKDSFQVYFMIRKIG